MSRNLVVCFDGTNNQFSVRNTDVVRLYQALDRDPALAGPAINTLRHRDTESWCLSLRTLDLFWNECGVRQQASTPVGAHR